MTNDEMKEDFKQDMLRDQYQEVEDAKRDYRMENDILFAFTELDGEGIVDEFNNLLYGMNKLGYELSPNELMELL